MDCNEAIKILIEKQHEIEEYGATDLAIEALEKQVPKKVRETVGDYENSYYCDRCGQNLRYEHQKYCEDCGGKQSW